MKQYPLKQYPKPKGEHSSVFICLMSVISMLVSMGTCTYMIIEEHKLQDKINESLKTKVNYMDTKISMMQNEISLLDDSIARMISEKEEELEEQSITIETSPVYQAIPVASTQELLIEELESKVYWDSSDNGITNITGASAGEFDDLISRIMNKRQTYSTKMNGTGSTLVEVEETYGISGTAILSIITWESDFGDQCIQTNNLCGIRRGGAYASFNSPDECILYLGQLLNSYVEEHGLTSWDDIGARYCESAMWTIEIPNTVEIYNDEMDSIMYKNNSDETNT